MFTFTFTLLIASLLFIQLVMIPALEKKERIKFLKEELNKDVFTKTHSIVKYSRSKRLYVNTTYQQDFTLRLKQQYKYLANIKQELATLTA